ncbi:MAG TPA: ABC transporter permease [Gammaproteobacteria bacterium]
MSAVWTVCRKELLDNARDRRTLFSAFVFGPLLGPVLFAVLVSVVVTQTVSTADAPIDVPIVGGELAPNLVEHLEARGISPAADHGLAKFAEAAEAVLSGAHDAVLLIDPDFAERFAAGDTARVTLVYDQSNTRAAGRVRRIRAAVSSYAQQLGTLKLIARGVDPDVLSTVMLDELDVSTAAGRSVVLLGMLTYFLLLATLMGGFYLAIDSTAGERERRSLEPLLTTPVERSSLLLGKMTATTIYMLLALALTLVGFAIALRFVSLEPLGMSSGFGVGEALAAFAVLAPFAPLGAALMTLVASFTKSYKEAQTYLTLVLLVPTLPLVFATMLNVKPTGALMWVPSLSQHLLVTALVRQDPIPLEYITQSALATLAAAAVLALAAMRLFERERVLG